MYSLDCRRLASAESQNVSCKLPSQRCYGDRQWMLPYGRYCLQSVYSIEREQRQIFSPPSSDNFLSRLASALDMRKAMGSMPCDLCIHLCSNVQFAHSVPKQASSSLALPLWFPFMVCFFSRFVHGPSDKPWKQVCKNKQIVHALYHPLKTIQTLKCFFSFS